MSFVALSFIILFALAAVLALQFLPSAVASSKPHLARTQSVPLTQTLTLRRGYYNYYEVDSFSTNSSVAYSMLSSAPISTALMNLSQLDQFSNDSSDPISNSITYVNGTSVQNNVTVGTGQYFLVFYAYQSRANIQFGLLISPSTPFSYGPVSGPLGAGITTFGLSNNSGIVTPYEIKTNEIVGTANISAFQVSTPDAAQYGVSPTGATLQLNTLLVTNDNNGTGHKVYWVQTVPDFETGIPQVSFGDEIWNFTDLSGVLSNQSVTSTNFQNGGFVSPTGQGNTGPYVYNYNGPNETYNLPLSFALLSKETILPKTGILVQQGYALIANGSTTISQVKWYDNITIVDPSIQTAYFDVSGTATTPIGLFYDAELVFAGEGNLEVAHFTQFNASLGLFYQSSAQPSAMLSSFPSYYSFSGNTGEAVDDLVVTYSNGIATVGTGFNPNYSYLGNSSLTFNLQSLGTQTTQTTTTTSTSVISSTSTSQITTSHSSSTSVSTTSTSQSSSTTSAVTSSNATSTAQTTSSTLTTTTVNSTPNLSPGTSSDQGTGSSSNSTSASSSTSSTNTPITSSSSTMSRSNSETPAWEWIVVGMVVGVIIASLVITAVRRKPTPPQMNLT